MAHELHRGSPTASVARRPRFSARRLAVLALLVAVVAVGVNVLRSPGDPVLGNPEAPILIAWTSDSLMPALADGARAAEGIGAVATARNGVAWLTSWEADGSGAQAPAEGFMVPVEVLAVVPGDYSKFVPEPLRALFEGLEQGGALLGASGAALRGIESEGSVSFPRATVPVAGVVPDNLVASHEVVMSIDTARSLGISDLRYILIELEPGTDRAEAERALRSNLPAGARLGVRAPGEADILRPGGTILPQVEIKTIFGEFAGRPGSGRSITLDPKWITENTSNVELPLLGSARCHNKVIPQVRGALQEVIDSDLAGLIKKGDFGGCFAPRLLNTDPNSGLSHHAWGIALDINVSGNPYGAEPSMDLRLVEIFNDWGLTWGGNWVVPDGMHFEYLTEPVSP